MPKVRIYLDPGETELDAAHALQKALDVQSSGAAHDEETFDDPAMNHVADRMEEIHARIYTDMLREISDVLDEEVSEHGH